MKEEIQPTTRPTLRPTVELGLAHFLSDALALEQEVYNRKRCNEPNEGQHDAHELVADFCS
jgi:hypothetical protein